MNIKFRSSKLFVLMTSQLLCPLIPLTHKVNIKKNSDMCVD